MLVDAADKFMLAESGPTLAALSPLATFLLSVLVLNDTNADADLSKFEQVAEVPLAQDGGNVLFDLKPGFKHLCQQTKLFMAEVRRRHGEGRLACFLNASTNGNTAVDLVSFRESLGANAGLEKRHLPLTFFVSATVLGRPHNISGVVETFRAIPADSGNCYSLVLTVVESTFLHEPRRFEVQVFLAAEAEFAITMRPLAPAAPQLFVNAFGLHLCDAPQDPGADHARFFLQTGYVDQPGTTVFWRYPSAHLLQVLRALPLVNQHVLLTEQTDDAGVAFFRLRHADEEKELPLALLLDSSQDAAKKAPLQGERAVRAVEFYTNTLVLPVDLSFCCAPVRRLRVQLRGGEELLANETGFLHAGTGTAAAETRAYTATDLAIALRAFSGEHRVEENAVILQPLAAAATYHVFSDARLDVSATAIARYQHANPGAKADLQRYASLKQLSLVPNDTRSVVLVCFGAVFLLFAALRGWHHPQHTAAEVLKHRRWLHAALSSVALFLLLSGLYVAGTGVLHLDPAHNGREVPRAVPLAYRAVQSAAPALLLLVLLVVAGLYLGHSDRAQNAAQASRPFSDLGLVAKVVLMLAIVDLAAWSPTFAAARSMVVTGGVLCLVAVALFATSGHAIGSLFKVPPALAAVSQPGPVLATGVLALAVVGTVFVALDRVLVARACGDYASDLLANSALAAKAPPGGPLQAQYAADVELSGRRMRALACDQAAAPDQNSLFVAGLSIALLVASASYLFNELVALPATEEPSRRVARPVGARTPPATPLRTGLCLLAGLVAGALCLFLGRELVVGDARQPQRAKKCDDLLASKTRYLLRHGEGFTAEMSCRLDAIDLELEAQGCRPDWSFEICFFGYVLFATVAPLFAALGNHRAPPTVAPSALRHCGLAAYAFFAFYVAVLATDSRNAGILKRTLVIKDMRDLFRDLKRPKQSYCDPTQI